MKKHKEDDVPGCCDAGDKRVSWIVNAWDDGKYWTGWGMVVGYDWECPIYEQINFCPFCGTSLLEE